MSLLYKLRLANFSSQREGGNMASLAQLAKCGRCNSRLIAAKQKRIVYYICPKMRKRSCKGCYMREEVFIKQLTAILKRRRVEVVLEEKRD